MLKSEEDVPREHLDDLTNYEALKGFFDDFQPKGRHPGLFNEYRSEKEFREQFTRNILTKVFSYLHSMDGKRVAGAREWESCASSGYKAIYIDGTNDLRNKAKVMSVRMAKEVRLQAHSCYSFLCEEGPFHKIFREILDKSEANIRIIMQNPWSLNSVRNSLTKEELEMQGTQFEALHNGKLSSDTILELHEKSQWFSLRYKASSKGFEKLKKDFGNRIQLRMSDSDLSNSILLTDDDVFFEPYFRTINRGTKNLSLFEIQADRDSDLYTDAEKDFEDTWENSFSEEEYDVSLEKEGLELYIMNHGGI